MKNKTLTTFVLFILLLTTSLFYSCDKEGNPLPDGRFVEITYNGETFIQQRKAFVLSSFNGPNFDYYYYNLPQSANGVKYIELNATLRKKDSKDGPGHRVFIKIPVGDEILLNHEYVIKSLPDKRIINSKDEGLEIYRNSNMSYIRFISYLNNSQYLFGDGKVYFTKITKNENGVEDIEGTFEFSIPSFAENDGFDVIKGKFKLYLNKV
ncbi:hypothetical protein [Sphingobacterium endophyticum]|uniref:hypothetical protein n=1 Tax=Sphingobacterium endophyticum TaxID=2546448 RepID=UPI0012E2C888|nr:hypothetical protein [Sphingobacterium endophyticum]